MIYDRDNIIGVRFSQYSTVFTVESIRDSATVIISWGDGSSNRTSYNIHILIKALNDGTNFIPIVEPLNKIKDNYLIF